MPLCNRVLACWTDAIWHYAAVDGVANVKRPSPLSEKCCRMNKNLAASLRERLKQPADARKQDFNLTPTHFGLERLLYRLSIADYASNYQLTGTCSSGPVAS
jgi:hypothetical protein